MATIDTLLYGGRATVHFHTGKHYYTVSVPELGYGKGEDCEFSPLYQPGVTTILDVKDKSGPLQGWAVNQCEAYALEEIDRLQANSPGLESVQLDDFYKILRDMKRNYRDVRRKAAEIGVAVHDFLHRYLEAKMAGTEDSVLRPGLKDLPEGSTPDMLDKVHASIDAGLEWFRTHKLTPMRMETPVWSPIYGYIGTGDFIGMVDGELCVCDYKTSSGLYSTVWLQTAAYQMAYEEEFPHLEIKARWGINVGKDGLLTAIRRDNEFLEDDTAGFLGAFELWKWDRIHDKGSTVPGAIGELPELEPANAVADANDWIDQLEAA